MPRTSQKNAIFWCLTGVCLLLVGALLWIQKAKVNPVVQNANATFSFFSQQGRLSSPGVFLDSRENVDLQNELFIIGKLVDVDVHRRMLKLSPVPAAAPVEVAVPGNGFQIPLVMKMKTERIFLQSSLFTDEGLLKELSKHINQPVRVKILYEMKAGASEQLKKECKPSVCSLLDMWSFYQQANTLLLQHPLTENVIVGPLLEIELGDQL